ncbi:MAG: hypothetical protein A2W18_00555 [Candidatus Muproteobacteria bacterium RBG_16_60_9]|uniref:DUF2065 domain-containing protein n=1 Tax=Candidatus Muproteobacteria bacterium RBG_16_60_9 TaxID=1817755 RepID=A0A1F6VA52_9PROT|nr:MAG: hypothetical protein A2W18_00555 [Candidatus Muproteobacteria bacterium RBG_16_60_9]
MWHDFAAALALVLVLEGLLPFASPGAIRRTLETINQLSDNQLRASGLASMLLGLLLLYFINR